MAVEAHGAPVALGSRRRPSIRAGPQRRFRRDAPGDERAVFDYAADLMAAVEQEIGDLWRDTLDGGDALLSDRLVELSHAVRRAALAFQNEPTIGRVEVSSAGHDVRPARPPVG